MGILPMPAQSRAGSPCHLSRSARFLCGLCGFARSPPSARPPSPRGAYFQGSGAKTQSGSYAPSEKGGSMAAAVQGLRPCFIPSCVESAVRVIVARLNSAALSLEQKRRAL
jgi:hypothetical protein